MQFTSIKFILSTSQKKSTSGITEKLPERKYKVGKLFPACHDVFTLHVAQIV